MQDYAAHWDDKFKTRSWGRYPPEDLVRFIGRHYKNSERASLKIAEIGCGPGANLWFLHREGYTVSGIDISPTAIDIARDRLKIENSNLNQSSADLRVGNFSTLPWADEEFDLVIDIFAIYANRIDTIQRTLSEVKRVLKPGGQFYCKLWGRETTGFGSGHELEDGTYDNIPVGPCKDMGVSHFFDIPEIENVYGHHFHINYIDKISRNDHLINSEIEEYHCHFIKAD